MVPSLFRFQFKLEPDTANLVASERHAVTAQQPVIVLQNGGFYTATLLVQTGAGVTLTAGIDYRIVAIDPYVTMKTGYAAAQAIEILTGLPGDFDVTYHAVGGLEGQANQLLVDLKEAIENVSTSAITWAAIAATAPATFPPSLHTHYPSQLNDLDLLAQEFRLLREAMADDRVLKNSGRDLSDRLDRLERLMSEQRNSINAIHYNVSSADTILQIKEELEKYEENPDIINSMLQNIEEVVSEWDSTGVKTARGHVTFIAADGNTHSEDILVAHNGTTAFLVNYARLVTDVDLFTHDVTILGGMLQYKVNPNTDGDIQVKWISIN